jgi:hypothetical protein
MKKKRLSAIAVLGIAVICSITLTACPNRRGEGPAERVGKTMDDGAAAVGRGVEKTGEVLQDASGH